MQRTLTPSPQYLIYSPKISDNDLWPRWMAVICSSPTQACVSKRSATKLVDSLQENRALLHDPAKSSQDMSKGFIDPQKSSKYGFPSWFDPVVLKCLISCTGSSWSINENGTSNRRHSGIRQSRRTLTAEVTFNTYSEVKKQEWTLWVDGYERTEVL